MWSYKNFFIILVLISFKITDLKGQQLIPIEDIFSDTVNFTINGAAGLNSVDFINSINSEQIDISFTYPLTARNKRNNNCDIKRKVNTRFKFNAKNWIVFKSNDTVLFRNFFFPENYSAFYLNFNYLILRKIKYQGYCYGDIPNNYFYLNSYFLANYNKYQYLNEAFYTILLDLGIQSGIAFEITTNTKFLMLGGVNLYFLKLIPENYSSNVIEKLVDSPVRIHYNYIGSSAKLDIQINNIKFYFEIATFKGIGKGINPPNFNPYFFNIGTSLTALGFSL